MVNGPELVGSTVALAWERAVRGAAVNAHNPLVGGEGGDGCRRPWEEVAGLLQFLPGELLTVLRAFE